MTSEFSKQIEKAIETAPKHPSGRLLTLDEVIAWMNGWNPVTGKWVVS